ncbi:hypothetical protein GCM10023238_39640 [Streptomyces heliomycini]
MRSTLEGLVARNQAQRTKQGSSVFYTTVDSAGPAPKTECRRAVLTSSPQLTAARATHVHRLEGVRARPPPVRATSTVPSSTRTSSSTSGRGAASGSAVRGRQGDVPGGAFAPRR